jgi:hypothetical protein
LLSFGAESFVFQFNTKNIRLKIHKTILLPVVSYEFKTWSLTLRGERRLRLSENMVTRRIFGPKRDEISRE